VDQIVLVDWVERSETPQSEATQQSEDVGFHVVSPDLQVYDVICSMSLSVVMGLDQAVGLFGSAVSL
jgi:hypothetical protein